MPQHGQHAGDGDVVDVVPGRRGERAVLAPAGHPAVDEPFVHRVQVGGPDAEPFRHPGPEHLDHHVGVAGQLLERGHALGGLQIQSDRVLAAVHDVGARAVGNRSDPVDSQDFGAVIG